MPAAGLFPAEQSHIELKLSFDGPAGPGDENAFGRARNL